VSAPLFVLRLGQEREQGERKLNVYDELEGSIVPPQRVTATLK
jgi:hypothetical protein